VTDVLAQDDHPGVAPHLLPQRLAQGFQVTDLSHRVLLIRARAAPGPSGVLGFG